MAKFLQLVMRQSSLSDDYLDQPAPDPAQFGLPAEDDGSRDDPLLTGNLAMAPFVPDARALRASSVRLIPAIGALGEGGLARRGGQALAALLDVEPVIFPGDHAGFAANEWLALCPSRRQIAETEAAAGACLPSGPVPASAYHG